MYRIMDMNDGSILAVVFTEKMAQNILSHCFDPNTTVDGDEETIRYVYEDLSQNPAYMIGQTLEFIGQKINHMTIRNGKYLDIVDEHLLDIIDTPE